MSEDVDSWPASRERRREPRRAASGHAWVWSDDAAAGPLRVWLRDESAGSVGLTSPAAVTAGTTVLLSRSESTALGTQALYEVIRCDPRGDAFVLGAVVLSRMAGS